jgi:CO/xanthine dehydrogenase FAD-binding subunit
VLGAVSPSPLVVDEAGARLVGSPLDEKAIGDAAEIAQHLARPLDNTDFAPHWRKQVVRTYVARALRELRNSQG